MIFKVSEVKVVKRTVPVAPEYEIRLIRHYPVYIGETEAQAYKRKLAEEAAEKET